MRHSKRFNHLGRTRSHRKAMLSNMASSLILHKRINTTLAKAKALRKYVEPLITKSRNDTTHSRRVVFSYLRDKESINILFNEIAEKIATRPGGYTRILKTGHRLGDKASMCLIELVDYNENYLVDTSKTTKRKTRRRGKGKVSDTESVQVADSDTTTSEEKKGDAGEPVKEKESAPSASKQSDEKSQVDPKEVKSVIGNR